MSLPNDRVRFGETEGFLFDVYNADDEIHLWLKESDGKLHHFTDSFRPLIFAKGRQSAVDSLIRRLKELDALSEEPHICVRRSFYDNQEEEVTGIFIKRPALLPRIKNNLYRLYDRIDIYHTDTELPTAYMNARGIHPLGFIKVKWYQTVPKAGITDAGSEITASESENNKYSVKRIISTESIDSLYDFQYKLPEIKTIRLALTHSHRLGAGPQNPLILETDSGSFRIRSSSARTIITEFSEIIKYHDPDLILSSRGDHTIFPWLFENIQKYRLPSSLDRDANPPPWRSIKKKGSSFNTYGSWIFKAPSYPLFGRWHIDAANSFVFKETDLYGIIELARISRIPVQKLSRSSTGGALTSIESVTALAKNYLIPWQKSMVENPRSAYDLLITDKGGLVFQPDIKKGYVFENVAQIDFSQMYPTIMDVHNISPETVQCRCCNQEECDHVPDTKLTVCRKRRGIVSDSLHHILDRRRFYKSRIKELKARIRITEKTAARESVFFKKMIQRRCSVCRKLSLKPVLKRFHFLKNMYDSRQNSLKWMLVTSFGYLGYRNAKFGRLESHESVTAYGRDKLLTAMHLAEDNGFTIIHAITDCLFLQFPDHLISRDNDSEAKEALSDLCSKITERTAVTMSIEGIYSWLVFPASRTNPGISVANRYLGRFSGGGIKVRGIAVRRRDSPGWIKKFQNNLLDLLESKVTASDVMQSHESVIQIYNDYIHNLKENRVPLKDLLVTAKAGRPAEDYKAKTAVYHCLTSLKENMNISVQPGEKVRWITVLPNQSVSSLSSERVYIPEEILILRKINLNQDAVSQGLNLHFPYYEELLRKALLEIWEHFAPEDFLSEEKNYILNFAEKL